MNDLTFLLGTHRPNWLWKLADVPLFVSYRQLRGRKSPYPRATTGYAIDSGGFFELQLHGRWTVTPEQYVTDLYRFWNELGPFKWAAPQDWMCEPAIINGGTYKGGTFAGTHLSVLEHQKRTVDNFLELRRLAPDLPIIPVLQGFKVEEYHRHVEMYAEAGVDLTIEPLVGVGSVCRRESTSEAALIFQTLAARGLRLHGFGVKGDGIDLYYGSLESSDSLSWSAAARRAASAARRAAREAGIEPPLMACGKKACNNCAHYALAWRDRILAAIERCRTQVRQMALPLFGSAA